MTQDSQHPPNQLRTLDAADFLNILDNAPGQNEGNVRFQTHILPSRLDRVAARIHLVGYLTGRHPDDGAVNLKGHFLSWRHRSRQNNLVLAHAQEALVTADHRLIIRLKSGHNYHLPQLCRPKPLAALINALIAGRINPDEPHRTSCLSCANLGPNRQCSLKPNPAPKGVCCPTQPNQDWCPQHLPAAA